VRSDRRAASYRRVLRFYEVCKLRVSKTAITRCVNSSDDLNEFCLKSVDSMAPQEAREVIVSNFTSIASVNRAESCMRVVVTSQFKVSFKRLKVPLKG
jgi:hypothetical protein